MFSLGLHAKFTSIPGNPYHRRPNVGSCKLYFTAILRVRSYCVVNCIVFTFDKRMAIIKSLFILSSAR